MYERFTDSATNAMRFAEQEAIRRNLDFISTGHILFGLVKEKNSTAAIVLKNLESKILSELERFDKGISSTTETTKLPQTPPAKKVIEYAMEEARSLNHNYVGTEHLLIGLIRESDGVAAKVLTGLGLTLEAVRNEVKIVLNHPLTYEPEPEPEQPPVVYQKYQGVESVNLFNFLLELNRLDEAGWTEIVKIDVTRDPKNFRAILKRPN